MTVHYPFWESSAILIGAILSGLAIPLRDRRTEFFGLCVAVLLMIMGYEGAAHQEIVFPSDAWNYQEQFYAINGLTFIDTLAAFDKDKGFTAILYFASGLHLDFPQTRGLIWVLSATFLYVGTARLTNHRWAALCLSLSHFSPFFYAYMSNTIRQGLAISILVLALSFDYARARPTLYGIFLGSMAASMHWSAGAAYLAMSLGMKLRNKQPAIISAWMVCGIGYIAGLNAALTPLVQQTHVAADYATEEVASSYGRSGVRLDFILASIALAAVLWLIQRSKEADKSFLNIYLCLNSLFFLLGFVPFSDRIASYSWVIWMPLVTFGLYQSVHKTTMRYSGDGGHHAVTSMQEMEAIS